MPGGAGASIRETAAAARAADAAALSELIMKTESVLAEEARDLDERENLAERELLATMDSATSLGRLRHSYAASLARIQMMQHRQVHEPVVPFHPWSKLVREISRDYKRNLAWSVLTAQQLPSLTLPPPHTHVSSECRCL